ncbi:MAG: hypothetical protein GHHEDOFH_02351 [Pseudorhodoplanes sp.]|nr:hypothetical protein [Pseudorhodoplanes sp.]
MAYFEWRSDFETGIHVIDYEHRLQLMTDLELSRTR